MSARWCWDNNSAARRSHPRLFDSPPLLPNITISRNLNIFRPVKLFLGEPLIDTSYEFSKCQIEECVGCRKARAAAGASKTNNLIVFIQMRGLWAQPLPSWIGMRCGARGRSARSGSTLPVLPRNVQRHRLPVALRCYATLYANSSLQWYLLSFVTHSITGQT